MSIKKQNRTGEMEQNENNQSENKAHKGLSLRKSYSQIVEHGNKSGQLQSIKMDRQGSTKSMSSNNSIASDSTESTTLSTESVTGIQVPGQPKNFGTVAPGIYRSSYPQDADYPFLKRLHLKTIVTLVDKDIPETFVPFMKANNIQHRQITMEGTKKSTISISTMTSILELILDKRNQPVLIHCNQGKHRTGCVVAITRLLQQWDTERAVDEYKTFANPKIRDGDLEYIRKFQLSDMLHLSFAKPAVCPVISPVMIASQEVVVRPRPMSHFRKYRIITTMVLLFVVWNLGRLTPQRQLSRFEDK